jgi:MoaA/NifB/PqqE/SkfB family radical SAM enzyme
MLLERLVDPVERFLKQTLPRGSRARAAARYIGEAKGLALHTIAERHRSVIGPDLRDLYISLTANCNFRCRACLYGRSFMPGHQLPWSLGAPLLDDAKALGFHSVRLYGGEPLIHRDIEKYVERIAANGMNMWLTTNGLLLDRKIDRLFAAGLRRASVGFYGVGEAYDHYVQRRGAFEAVERSVAGVRRRYGADRLPMHLDWLLMRPTGTPDSVEATLRFARRYDLSIFVNLIHYSLPYFLSDDTEAKYSFREADRPALDEVVAILLDAKRRDPDLMRNSERGLRSIPDWLILGPAMRVPCTGYDMVWVGPDGTVQMCYVTFKLGNLHAQRLSDMLLTDAHKGFARDAFALNCPNCHCGYDKRVQRHAASRSRYAS